MTVSLTMRVIEPIPAHVWLFQLADPGVSFSARSLPDGYMEVTLTGHEDGVKVSLEVLGRYAVWEEVPA
jgi:hypothetical protein